MKETAPIVSGGKPSSRTWDLLAVAPSGETFACLLNSWATEVHHTQPCAGAGAALRPWVRFGGGSDC